MSMGFNFGKAVFSVYDGLVRLWSGSAIITPDSFCASVREKGREIFNLQFKDASGRLYLPQEYAVHIGNIDIMKHLIALGGAKIVNYGYNQKEGANTSLVHFYMRELKEPHHQLPPPNLEMLHLLLDNLESIHVQEESTGQTILEAALIHMSHFKQIHWDVIECLLKRGITINGSLGSTSFKRLLSCYVPAQSKWGQPMRTAADERCFLGHLVCYRNLESKKQVVSVSCLNRQEFESLTTVWRASLQRAKVDDYYATLSIFCEDFNAMEDFYIALVPEEHGTFDNYIRPYFTVGSSSHEVV